MTSKISLFVAILTCVSMLSSCLKDTEVVTYGDTAITSFSLGMVKSQRTIKKSNGQDSTYTYRYSAASYPITIDQIGRKIYNIDSLAVGTDLTKVLTSIYTMNGGVVLLKSRTDDTFAYYNSSDSIDFSNSDQSPRIFRVVSSNGAQVRDYAVSIVAHKEHGDSVTWRTLPDCDYAKAYSKMATVQLNDNLYVLGMTKDAEGNFTAQQLIATQDAEVWTECSLPAGMNVAAQSSLVVFAGEMYLFNDNKLYASHDASSWHVVNDALVAKNIIAGCNDELYAQATDNSILVSKDKGVTWTVDQAPEAGVKLPDNSIATVVTSLATNKEVGRVVMIANSDVAADTTAVVWNKYVDPDNAQNWIYTEFVEINKKYRLPDMKDMSATIYVDEIYLIGGAGSKDSKGYGMIYNSPDFGLTWHTSNTMKIPANVEIGESAVLTSYKDADDTKSFMLVIAAGTGKVYACRINRLAWKKEQVFFQ